MGRRLERGGRWLSRKFSYSVLPAIFSNVYGGTPSPIQDIYPLNYALLTPKWDLAPSLKALCQTCGAYLELYE